MLNHKQKAGRAANGVLVGVAVLLGLAVLVSAGLLLGWLAFGWLPDYLVGVAMLTFGLALLTSDLFVAGHGLPASVGVVALLLGGGLLFSTGGGWLAAIGPLLLGLSLVFSLFCAWLVVKAVEVQRLPASSGRETLIGQLAEVRVALDPQGFVYAEGALWRAVCAVGSLPVGAQVRVTAISGLTLSVTPLASLPAGGPPLPGQLSGQYVEQDRL